MSRYVLCFVTCLLCFFAAFLILSGPALAQGDIDLYRPKYPTFTDVERVGLYVHVPLPYEDALKCHGREEECANENAPLARYPERREEYIRHLKEKYDDYPAPIQLKRLEALFAETIQRRMSPFMVSDTKEPVILDSVSVRDFAEEPGNLTLVVRLTMIRHTTPKIAVIDYGFYRGADHADYVSIAGLRRATAFPLNISDDEIEKHITGFVGNLRVPLTEKGVRQ